MTPRRWMVVGGLLLALASTVAGANEPEVFLKFDWHAQGEPAVSSLKIKDYPMAEDMVLPAPFFVGSLACVEAAVPLAGKLNRTRSCFRLGIENGLPVALDELACHVRLHPGRRRLRAIDFGSRRRGNGPAALFRGRTGHGDRQHQRELPGCVFEWTAASGPLQTMTCVLKRPAAH